jgi:hypothetical protein
MQSAETTLKKNAGTFDIKVNNFNDTVSKVSLPKVSFIKLFKSVFIVFTPGLRSKLTDYFILGTKSLR